MDVKEFSPIALKDLLSYASYDIILKIMLILMSLLQSTKKQTNIFSALVCPAAAPATFASMSQLQPLYLLHFAFFPFFLR
jgi:hypothetical protein